MRIDLTGQTFGRLTVAGPTSGPDKGRVRAHWSCACTCGQNCVARGEDLKAGKIVSCGCRRQEVLAVGIAHKHGKSATPEYRNWKGLRVRCLSKNNPNYPKYGGRGIKVCERWNSFKNFLADMGPRPTPKHSIDRINNDGNYEPGNCRWATPLQQVNNRSVSKSKAA